MTEIIIPKVSRRSLLPLALGGAALLAFPRSGLLVPSEAEAANRTAWTAGNGQGLTWGTAVNSVDLASMATGKTVVSSVADITNGTSLDQYMDISFNLAIASSAVAAGANIAFWIYELNQDGSTYGDAQFTNGTPASLTPTFAPCFVFPLVVATETTFNGINTTPIIIPAGSFRIACQNNCGFTFTAGTQTVKYRTYNTQLNN